MHNKKILDKLVENATWFINRYLLRRRTIINSGVVFWVTKGKQISTDYLL